MFHRSTLVLLLAVGLSACSSFTTAEKGAAEGARIGATRTVVFIHGLYMTPRSWSGWKAHFEAAGYKVHTPAYPLHDRDPAAMRAAHPDADLAALSLDLVKDHLRGYIAGLPEKPIVVGHSMGGLVAQIMLNEGLAAGAIALDSAPPYGVVSQLTAARHGFDFVRAGWPIITPFAGDDEPILLDEEGFAWGFANGMSEDEQRRAYNEFCVPTSRRLARGALSESGSVDFARRRGPLLLVAGEIDRIIPASINRLNYDEYSEAAGRTEFREFPGRGHFIAGQPGWEEVADFVLQWIERNR